MGPANPPLPPELLHAVAEQAGRIALVVGAGCSLEQPTGLGLATEYSLDVHRQLVQDGLLVEGECEHPEDLSLLASTVWERVGSQSPVVDRLPLNEFRQAQPNDGYLIAAALLREGVVSAVLSLNFDLAMTAGLGRVSAKEVDVVSGPAAIGQLGAATVIYLHRNVDELNADRWILRVEALQQEWQGGWEEIVAQRVMSCPVVVFAGLGSPAAVLTETVGHVRNSVGAGHHAFVVDPAEQSEFQDALNLPPAAHVQLGWCAFMEQLAERLVSEYGNSLTAVCGELCLQNGWIEEEGFAVGLCERLHAIGLIRLGGLRASWLLDSASYSPDDARRGLLADLLLGIGLVERHHGGEAHFRENGAVQIFRDGQLCAPFLAVSGSGTLRWNAVEAKVRESLKRFQKIDRPGAALLSGVQGGRPDNVAAPEDVVGDWSDDIAQGEIRTDLLTVDEIRENPLQSQRLVA